MPLITAEQNYTNLIVNGDVGAYKTLNADGSANIYRDTRDTERLQQIIDDSFVSANSSYFTYTARGDYGYPAVPSNTRVSSFYNNIKSRNIPEDWFDNNMQIGDLDTDIAPSGYTYMEEYLNTIDNGFVNNIPVITRTDSNPTTIEIGGVYTPPTGTWTDVEDGSGVATLGGDVVDVNTAGVYNVTLFHTDTDMNTGTLVIPITIVDPNEGNQYFTLTDRQIKDSQIAKKQLIKTL